MKAHLLDSAVPLKEGPDYIGLCGEVVKNSRYGYLFDEIGMGESAMHSLPLKGICKQCRLALYAKPSIGRYLYGFTEMREGVE